MTYASIILPYSLTKYDVNENPKTTQSLKGKLTSAMQKGSAAVKNAIQNPGDTFQNLGKYMQTAEKTVSKFSGIAVAQLLANGQVTNKDALDYLFLGFAPALDQQAIAMGYSGVTQMKDAIASGSINVGSFVSGFSKTLKGITDYTNGIKNKNAQKENNVIELDIVLNHNEDYQSEAPDRRVEVGKSFQEVLHNLPEVFAFDCGLQDGRRYGVSEFKGYLKQLRESKQVFSMIVGDEQLDYLILQSFRPAVLGARSGLDYTLEVKRIDIGSIEITPITIEPLNAQYETGAGQGTGSGSTLNNSVPNYNPNPTTNNTKLTPKKNQSLWAYTTDLGEGNAFQGALRLMGIGQ